MRHLKPDRGNNFIKEKRKDIAFYLKNRIEKYTPPCRVAPRVCTLTPRFSIVHSLRVLYPSVHSLSLCLPPRRCRVLFCSAEKEGGRRRRSFLFRINTPPVASIDSPRSRRE